MMGCFCKGERADLFKRPPTCNSPSLPRTGCTMSILEVGAKGAGLAADSRLNSAAKVLAWDCLKRNCSAVSTSFTVNSLPCTVGCPWMVAFKL